jgi:hypothetical protein
MLLEFLTDDIIMLIKLSEFLGRLIRYMVRTLENPWLKKCFITLNHLINVLLFSKYNPNIKGIKLDDNKKCYILGNGPSLKGNLQNNLAFLSGSSLIVVNDISLSEYFQILQPKFYVLADPGYWDSNIFKELKDKSKLVLDAILDKTKWPMYLIIPYLAYSKKSCRSYFKSNKNITLVYYNSTTFNGFEFLNRFIYKHYLGMAKPQNVLIPCLYIALNSGFKEINLLGVDHSWTQYLFVNEENMVCLIDNHFYDNQLTIPIPIRTCYGDYYRMHQILINFSIMFEGYHIIRKYADYIDAKIYNRTIGSFIDAFERKNLIE